MNSSEKDNTYKSDNGWIGWALMESLIRSIFKIFQRIVGGLAGTLPAVFAAAAVVGLVQGIAGLATSLARGATLRSDRRAVILSLAFGVCSFWSIAGNFWVFLLGGDMGTNAFIISLGIFLGAYIDKLRFGRQLHSRQWAGVGLAVVAGYMVLGFPTFRELALLPLWVFLSVGAMLTTVANQWISQEIKYMNPAIKNMWGGVTTFVLALIFVYVFSMYSPSNALAYARTFSHIIPLASLTGIIIFIMWMLDLIIHKKGATIATKKLVVNSGYLFISMAIGVAFYGDAASLGKVLGLGLYFPAFFLLHSNALETILQSGVAKQARNATCNIARSIYR